MPSASVRTATRVNPGVRRKVRKAKLRSRRNVRHRLARFMLPPFEELAASPGCRSGRRLNHQKTETERAIYEDDGGAKWSCLKFMGKNSRGKGSTGFGLRMFRASGSGMGHFGRG